MNSKALQKDLKALRYLRNAIVHGHSPSVRDLQRELRYQSPRSAAEILDRLIEKGYIARRPDGRLQLRQLPVDDAANARTVNVPLVGMAPCGAPLLAEENIEAMIPVSTRLARPPHKYFLLRASGTSMNKAGIQDGDLVLIRQQQAAESGDRIVAMIDDEATIKIFRRAGDVIALEPKSSDRQHKPVILTSDFRVQGVVVASIPSWKKGHSNG